MSTSAIARSWRTLSTAAELNRILLMLDVVLLAIGIMRNAAYAKSPRIAIDSVPASGPIDVTTSKTKMKRTTRVSTKTRGVSMSRARRY